MEYSNYLERKKTKTEWTKTKRHVSPKPQQWCEEFKHMNLSCCNNKVSNYLERKKTKTEWTEPKRHVSKPQQWCHEFKHIFPVVSWHKSTILSKVHTNVEEKNSNCLERKKINTEWTKTKHLQKCATPWVSTLFFPVVSWHKSTALTKVHTNVEETNCTQFTEEKGEFNTFWNLFMSQQQSVTHYIERRHVHVHVHHALSLEVTFQQRAGFDVDRSQKQISLQIKRKVLRPYSSS